MDWSHYCFRSVWDLPATPEAVFAVLEAVESYPSWWREIRETVRHDEDTGVVRIRSFLPYELLVTVRSTRRDPAAGVLEVAASGDLRGWARWTVGSHDGGTRAVYEQEVDVERGLMRTFAVPGRPVFLLNHALMMRSGRRGLAGYLQAG
ncbi:SRPBCC family protein [Streptomyces indicus]|uniref:Polyketide cyclase / dehydrase and lipid transport n=1 Tax=Streptomyces indicus TaxID=417292 RepID=A0A1G8XGA8_9ACTN|nr:SRPBCC family protein [Streptomyces indicus]SDJ89679.1 Polyketide cyclase / dehydrase and lipid transport [Streptomyces indicus]